VEEECWNGTVSLGLSVDLGDLIAGGCLVLEQLVDEVQGEGLGGFVGKGLGGESIEEGEVSILTLLVGVENVVGLLVSTLLGQGKFSRANGYRIAPNVEEIEDLDGVFALLFSFLLKVSSGSLGLFEDLYL
jgi:hypothetical protein